MGDLVTRLRLSSSEFDKNLEKSKQEVKDFQDTTEDASKTLTDMSKSGAKSAKELLKEMSSLETGTRSISNYRKQLSQLTRDITDLTVNYNNMTKEMQNSDLGREVVLKIGEMTREAAKYKDAIMDSQAAIKAMASDTANWDAVKQGMQVVSSTLQSVAAAGVLSADSTEKLVAVIAKLKSVEAATNAVIQIGNALQKQSALMTGIARVQTLALVKAKTLETTATKGATIAQKLFNAVANTNPYVLLATAALAVVSALVVFSKKTKENTELQKKEQEQLEKNKKAYEDYRSKVGTSVGDIVAKFYTLQRSYKTLSGEMDKKKWIDENATAFDNLGLKINNVNDADEVFTKNSEAVISALKARARAEALIGLYQDKIKEKTLAEIDAEKELANVAKARNKYYTTNGGLPQDLKDAGFKAEDLKYVWGGDQSGSGWYELTPAQVQKLNDYFKERAKEANQGVLDVIDAGLDIIEQKLTIAESEAADAAAKVQNLLKSANNTNTPGGNQTVKALEGSKKAVQDLISKQQQLVDAQVVGTEEWKKQKAILDSLQAQLDTIIATEKRLSSTPMTLPVLPKIEGKIEIGEQFKSGLVIPVKVQVEKATLNEAIDSITESISTYLGISTQFIGSLNSIYETFSSLGSKINDAESAWEKFFLVFEAGVSLINGFVGIVKSVGEAMTLLNSVLGISTAAKTADTAATTANTAAEISNAAAKGAAASAEGAKSVAGVPLAGPALAIAAVAAIMGALLAALSKAKAFAGGGIVGGHSEFGDKVLARVNSGEMILNKKQQSNLFNMLNEGRSNNNGGNSEVEFKIRGTELVGVLNNYSKKISKI